MGTQITMKGVPAQTAKFTQLEETKVFTTDDRPVQPGSDEIGYVATSLSVPLGYYKDEEKSARTFRTIDGVRWSFPGDLATVAADGTIELLGRSSQCINTGGEKVYPEEVEEAIKEHPGVVDCLVFGVEDERFGQRVAAVASLDTPGATDADAILAEVRTRLSSYKLPRQIALVDRVPRTPTGKADYPSAKEMFTDLIG